MAGGYMSAVLFNAVLDAGVAEADMNIEELHSSFLRMQIAWRLLRETGEVWKKQ